MDSGANISSKSWCPQCRRYIADPDEVGITADGLCPHFGWALLKSSDQDMGNEAKVFAEPELPNEPEEAFIAKKGKPFLRDGRGIAAQSAVQFSHEREEVVKSDPNVHRQNEAGMMGTLVGVMLGLCTVVAFFLFFPQENTAPLSGENPRVVDTQMVTGSMNGSKEEVIKFIDKVSRIEDVDQLLEVIRFPELLEPMVRGCHETVGTNLSLLNQLAVLDYSENMIYGSRFAALSMGGPSGEAIGFILVEITEGGKMLIDWEVLFGAAQRYWLEFDATKPTESVPLWVSMHRTSIIDLPLPKGEDPEQWMALKVMSPTMGLQGSVHLTLVKKGDAFGDYVEQHIPWNTEAPNRRAMTVKARFTDGASPMLVIDEFCAPGAFRNPTDDALYPLEKW